jgi:hypothetical protein
MAPIVVVTRLAGLQLLPQMAFRFLVRHRREEGEARAAGAAGVEDRSPPTEADTRKMHVAEAGAVRTRRSRCSMHKANGRVKLHIRITVTAITFLKSARALTTTIAP